MCDRLPEIQLSEKGKARTQEKASFWRDERRVVPIFLCASNICGYGTRRVVDGIDIWTFGVPPTKYQVIGIINDSRNGGLISRATFYPNIAAKVKQAGGDGAIPYSSESELRGFIGSSSGTASTVGHVNVVTGRYSGVTHSYGSSFTAPVVSKQSTWLVVKYVSKETGGNRERGRDRGDRASTVIDRSLLVGTWDNDPMELAGMTLNARSTLKRDGTFSQTGTVLHQGERLAFSAVAHGHLTALI
jgi:hypothetical protein